MKISKILILFVVLSLPVILYLLLTFYGKNEFDLPKYFIDRNEQCTDFVQISEIEDSLHTVNGKRFKLHEVLKENINVLHFPESGVDNQPLQNELKRLLDTFSDQEKIELHTILVAKDSSYFQGNKFINSENAYQYHVSSDFYDLLTTCYLALPTKNWVGDHPAEMKLDLSKILVLIDGDMQIRGYYDGLETKDVDRLILEIRILLSKKGN
ncbi:hypothetical protein JKA74_01645 [Marivirga sp. S37H4]|uniref:Uncharacterized protein n=1 Tax=Marivirga aurantiaca TaxID=2802615 RepID=A0A934WVC9_9BACT|nr:hypothetical protein [Marivirga aurantiaca]MBK6263723.1 hypothetical protein [Marivirga aurantiaca]